jgi:hypothetical protein
MVKMELFYQTNNIYPLHQQSYNSDRNPVLIENSYSNQWLADNQYKFHEQMNRLKDFRLKENSEEKKYILRIDD